MAREIEVLSVHVVREIEVVSVRVTREIEVLPARVAREIEVQNNKNKKHQYSNGAVITLQRSKQCDVLATSRPCLYGNVGVVLRRACRVMAEGWRRLEG